MLMNTPSLKTVMTALVLVSISANAKSACPILVTSAAGKVYPEAKLSSCLEEKDHGKSQFEVKLRTKDARKIEMDMDSSGSILLTEEIVSVDSVSVEAKAAFAAKYSNEKINGVERQTKPDGSVTYELAFKQKGKRHEATFRKNGEFVELE